MAELSRFYGIAIQNLVKWRRAAADKVLSLPDNAHTVEPKDYSELVGEMKRLFEENRKLRKVLGNLAYDRDILQEAYTALLRRKSGFSKNCDCTGSI